MTLFLAGLAVFFGTHLWTAFARKGREKLIANLGAGPYKGLYSLASLAGFALIILGWPGADASVLYAPPAWGRHAAFALTLLALILITAAYLPRGKIAATAKHPMLAGVKLWAFGHLLANGEVRSVILFGAFLAYGVIDRIAVKKRGEPTPTAGPAANDAIAVVAGAALWAAIYFFLHLYIAGVSLRP
ncbi:MAG: NnrU family protein [Parvularculaceae bacterium]|nr:NnrU family protein [Parvularculaceae bacterium]